jgi:drug/metabolite transporter (DMT)-like permease
MLVSFTGVCVVFYEHLADFVNPDFQFGIFLSVVSTITWAFGSLYTKKKAASFNPYFSLGLQMFISSLLLLGFTKISGIAVSVTDIPMNSWLAIAYLVLVGSVLTFIAFIYALQRLSPEISSIYAYINPIVAVLLGTLIFDESLTESIVFGGLITLVGLYVVNQSLRKNKL